MKRDEITSQPVVDNNAVHSLIKNKIRELDECIENIESHNRSLISKYEENVELLNVLRSEKSQMEAALI